MKTIFVLLTTLCWASPGAGQIGGRCEMCDLMYEGMPDDLSSETTIADPSQPGPPLLVRGTVLHADGKTPAEGVILYVYQTDAEGRYTPAPKQNHARQHGRLRGWMKTNRKGEFLFRTIRPASYPNSRIEAHIHAIVKEPGRKEYYIDDFLFDDDPNLPAQRRRTLENRGGSGILSLQKNTDGLLVASRTIVLGLNIPGYPK